MSTAKAEYIAASLCCSQVLWQKQQLMDYGIKLDHILIQCDNTSAINLSKNLIQYSRTKHIDIRHHFLCDPPPPPPPPSQQDYFSLFARQYLFGLFSVYFRFLSFELLVYVYV